MDGRIKPGIGLDDKIFTLFSVILCFEKLSAESKMRNACSCKIVTELDRVVCNSCCFDLSDVIQTPVP